MRSIWRIVSRCPKREPNSVLAVLDQISARLELTSRISGPKFDESALAWEIQISVPVIDPDTDKPIGAVTIGLDPSALVDTSA